MTDLRFRERDHRPSVGALATAVLVVGIQVLVLTLRSGHVGLWVGLTVIPAVAAPLVVVRRRAQTVVDERGITVDWGFGRGRTFPCADIRWIEVHRYSTQGGPAFNARITLVGGKRRSLPGLSSNNMFPNPDLQADFEEVRARWAARHDANVTEVPPTERDRSGSWRGVWPGVAALGCLALAVSAIVFTFGQATDDRNAELAVPDCGVTHVQPGPDDHSCRHQYYAYVTGVSAQWSPFGSSTATLQVPASPSLWTVSFGAANPLVERARPGDEVVVTMDAGDGFVDHVTYDGRDYPTTDAPGVEVPRTITAVIGFGFAALLFSAWAVASRRRGPDGGYPWWAPLSLPALAWCFAICGQAASEPGPLSWSEYVPGALLLVLGLSAGELLRRRQADRARKRAAATA